MPKKKAGHYCKVCGEHKANEKFSGKGHNAHICKKCSGLSAADKSEAMTLTRLHNMPFKYLNDSDKKWLENRTRDKRPKVKELAIEIFNMHFPHSKRNAQKKQLRLNEMIFTLNNSIIVDEDGDENIIDCKFTLNRKENILIMEKPQEEPYHFELEASDMKSLFNLIIHNYEVFCWDEDYCSVSLDDECDDYEDDETEIAETEILNSNEGTPTFSVWLKYADGKEQMIEYFDEILPDNVESLYFELYYYFEEYMEDEDEPNFIENLYYYSDLLDMANMLDYLINSGDVNQNNYTATSMFMDLLHLEFENQTEKSPTDRLYSIYTQSIANLQFFRSFITQASNENVSENSSGYERLNSFIKYVKDTITTPKGEIINIEDVNKMMIAIEEKYKLISLLSCNRKIKVLLLSNTHITFNSICSAIHFVNEPNKFYYELYLFHCKDENSANPAYIFLHELGHALQIHITHDYTQIPESFCTMSDELLGKPLEQGADATEIFADAFAIAMMRVFDWEKYSPFNELGEDVKSAFTQYIVTLIEFTCKGQ